MKKSNGKTARRTNRNSANVPAKRARHAVARETAGGVVQVIRPLSASSLKDILWETLTDLKHENILPNRADAIAAQSREILRTINAHVIGYEPRHTRGHPHPIYALTPEESTEHDFTQLTSVWR